MNRIDLFLAVYGLLLLSGCNNGNNPPPKPPQSPLPLTFVSLSGGTFEMGCPTNPPAPWIAEAPCIPRRFVTITAFRISTTPITISQYCDILMKAGETNLRTLHPTSASRILLSTDGKLTPMSGHENEPVGTSWSGASRFCDLLSKELGFRCRLPTEAEWEFAAAGVEGRVYPWGVAPIRSNVYFDEVGKNPPLATPDGVHDLNGPIYQWCLDSYVADFYRTAPTQDPLARGQTGTYAVRGGPMFRYRGDQMYFPACWIRFQSTDLRSRQPFESQIGIRVVIPLYQKENAK